MYLPAAYHPALHVPQSLLMHPNPIALSAAAHAKLREVLARNSNMDM